MKRTEQVHQEVKPFILGFERGGTMLVRRRGETTVSHAEIQEVSVATPESCQCHTSSTNTPLEKVLDVLLK